MSFLLEVAISLCDLFWEVCVSRCSLDHRDVDEDTIFLWAIQELSRHLMGILYIVNKIQIPLQADLCVVVYLKLLVGFTKSLRKFLGCAL